MKRNDASTASEPIWSIELAVGEWRQRLPLALLLEEDILKHML